MNTQLELIREDFLRKSSFYSEKEKNVLLTIKDEALKNKKTPDEMFKLIDRLPASFIRSSALFHLRGLTDSSFAKLCVHLPHKVLVVIPNKMYQKIYYLVRDGKEALSPYLLQRFYKVHLEDFEGYWWWDRFREKILPAIVEKGPSCGGIGSFPIPDYDITKSSDAFKEFKEEYGDDIGAVRHDEFIQFVKKLPASVIRSCLIIKGWEDFDVLNIAHMFRFLPHKVLETIPNSVYSELQKVRKKALEIPVSFHDIDRMSSSNQPDFEEDPSWLFFRAYKLPIIMDKDKTKEILTKRKVPEAQVTATMASADYLKSTYGGDIGAVRYEVFQDYVTFTNQACLRFLILDGLATYELENLAKVLRFLPVKVTTMITDDTLKKIGGLPEFMIAGLDDYLKRRIRKILPKKKNIPIKEGAYVLIKEGAGKLVPDDVIAPRDENRVHDIINPRDENSVHDIINPRDEHSVHEETARPKARGDGEKVKASAAFSNTLAVHTLWHYTASIVGAYFIFFAVL